MDEKEDENSLKVRQGHSTATFHYNVDALLYELSLNKKNSQP